MRRAIDPRAHVAFGYLLALAVAATARADKPKDWDDQQAEEDSYWSQVAYPNRARYRELVQEARILSANPQTAGNLQKAEELLREAITVEPKEPYAHFLLAEQLNSLRRYADCATEFVAVLDIDPDWRDPHDEKHGPAYIPFRAGFCLALAGRIEESITQYQKVVAVNFVGLPGAGAQAVTESTVRWNLGDSFHALGRLEEAIAEYERAIDIGGKGEAVLRFALGVAYDRDEEIEKSRDAMLAGIKANPTLHNIADPNVIYLPPEDEDYYHGLAYKATYDEQRILGSRVRAIAYFRRYVATVGEQTWVPRAQQHLASLGSTALGERDIEIMPGDAGEKDKEKIIREIVAAGPDLQKCLAEYPYSVVRVTLTLAPPLPADKKGKKGVIPPPEIRPDDKVSTLTLPLAPSAIGCAISRSKQLKLSVPSKGLTRITFDLIAP